MIGHFRKRWTLLQALYTSAVIALSRALYPPADAEPLSGALLALHCLRSFAIGLLLGAVITLVQHLSGCAPVDADVDCAPVPDVDLEFAALVDQAEAELGPLPIECVDQVHGVQLVVDESEMPGVCHREGRVLGCTAIDMNGYPHVWIVDCQADPGQTMRHERLHSLLICSDEDDPDHLRPIWRLLGLL